MQGFGHPKGDSIPGYRKPRPRVGGWEGTGSWGRLEPGSKNRKGELGSMRREGLSRQSLGWRFPARGKKAAPALKKGASQKQAGEPGTGLSVRKGRGLGGEGTGLGRSHQSASTRLLCQLLERMCRGAPWSRHEDQFSG